MREKLYLPQRCWLFVRGLFVTGQGRPSRFAWWLTGIAAGYLLLFGAILPFALRGVLESQLSAALNTRASVASLRCNPLTLTVTARGIEVPYPEGAAPEDSGPFLTMDEVEITPSLLSYFRLAPGIKSLRLVNPVVDITLSRKGGLSPHLFFPDSPEDAATAETEPKPLFPFLIYGLELQGGKITFRDAIRNVTHTVSDINLGVPFASTLKADKGIAVTPSLNATLNGQPLSFSGKALPFADTLRTEFYLHAGSMELEHFRAYLAPYTSLALQSGSLRTELILGLERAPEKPMHISLAGRVELDHLNLSAPDGARAFALEKGRLEVESALLAPLHLAVKECLLEKPYLAVRRKADGSLDWQGFIIPSKEEASAPAAPESTPPAAPETAAKEALPHIKAHSVRLDDGTIVWRDDTVPGGFSHTVEHIRVEMSELDTKDTGSVLFDLALDTTKQGGTIAASGRAALSPPAVNATLKTGGIPLSLAAPYVAQALPLNLEDGALEIDSAFTVTQSRDGGVRIAQSRGDVAVANLVLSQGTVGTPLVRAGRISVAETVADTAARSLSLGKVDIARVVADLTRQDNGELLLPVAAGAGGDASAQSGESAWKMDVGALRVADSAFTFHDRMLKKPARLAFADINCEVKGFSTESGKPLNLDLSFRAGRSGMLGLQAEGALAPLNLRWRTRFTRADLSFLSPYLGEFSTLTLAEAALNGAVDGELAMARPGTSPEIKAQGSLTLSNLELHDGKSEFASLGRFDVRSLRYVSSSNSTGAVSLERISVERPRLSLTMQENGVLSLARIFPALQAKEAASTKAPSAQAPPSPDVSAPTVVGGLERISVGAFSLTNGRFTFRDQRLAGRPSAVSLSEITLSANSLRSDPDVRSDFTLKAKLNDAPLSVTGTINPLLQPIALNSSAALKNFSLPSVSAYAEKFIDYPITKGQFSLDVDVNLASNQVDARNSLLFSQLTLGDKLNAPDAPNLPVQAAISLLSDRNGDVSLNIPVAGSMDDPQLRTGALVGKVFATIMLKTVSSPFSLVAGIVGGTINLLGGGEGPDLDVIAFRSGSGALNSQGRTGLKGLAAALKRQPNLRVTLTGYADGSERAAAVEDAVHRRMREAKYAALPRQERTAATAEAMRVSREEDAEEYARLLADVYVDFPFVRMAGPEARNQPPQEMLRRIHENIKFSDSDLYALAETRAKAVRDVLLAEDPALDKQLGLGKAAVTLDGKPEDKPTSYVKLDMK